MVAEALAGRGPVRERMRSSGTAVALAFGAKARAWENATASRAGVSQHWPRQRCLLSHRNGGARFTNSRMSGVWPGAQREKRPLRIAGAVGGQRAGPAGIATSRDRRERPDAGGPRDCWFDGVVVGSVVSHMVDRFDRRCPAPVAGLACSAMSLLPFRSSSSGTHGVAELDEGTYVTDGMRLFRVVQRLDPLRGAASAVLEDCLTLELRSYAAADLWEMGVRLVRPSSNCAVERPIRC